MVGVLISFDLPGHLYAEDVRAISASTIEKYGLREWKLAVMTNEIHGHLGIYSTLGAKMGLFALEKMGEGPLSILSYAGSVPPLSCLNDGLQISTGATLGHGAISLASTGSPFPGARFSKGDRSLELSLKKEYADRIARDIEEALRLYGHEKGYWQRVRALAFEYWSSWDRKEIFDIQDFNL